MKYVCPLCGGDLDEKMEFISAYGCEALIYVCKDCSTYFDSADDLDTEDED